MLLMVIIMTSILFNPNNIWYNVIAWSIAIAISFIIALIAALIQRKKNK